MFTVADWIIVAILGISGLFALFRGFIREAVALIGWVSAFVVAGRFNEELAERLTFFNDGSLRVGAAYIILFIVTLLVVGLCGTIIRTLMHRVGLSGTDRLLGMVFGIFRGVLIVCVVLALMRIGFNLHILDTLLENPNWTNSVLIPELQKVVDWFFVYSPVTPETLELEGA